MIQSYYFLDGDSFGNHEMPKLTSTPENSCGRAAGTLQCGLRSAGGGENQGSIGAVRGLPGPPGARKGVAKMCGHSFFLIINNLFKDTLTTLWVSPRASCTKRRGH